MSRIRISSDISQNDVIRVQEQFLSRGQWTLEREIYRSPDGRNSLELSLFEEKRFGPKLFTATIVSETGDRLTLRRRHHFSRRKVLSCDCYGRGYDHWADDPWSPDSRKVALFEADISQRGVSASAAFFDVAERKWIGIVDRPEILSHHMWSPHGQYYLFRSLHAWHLVDVNSRTVRTVGNGSGGYPKHCYLVSDEQILLLERSCALLSTKSLEMIWEEPLPEGARSRAYSLFDPGTQKIFLGINPSLISPPLREFVTASRWYAFQVV